MKCYIYDEGTGIFTGQMIVAKSQEEVVLNTPPGHGAREACGVDPVRQRIDINTGALVTYIPPCPGPEERHRFDSGKWEWVYVPTEGEVCVANRGAAYPSLAELADAMYWQSRGDSSKLDAYFAACEDVKKRFPKP